jgi:hypothetical protein
VVGEPLPTEQMIGPTAIDPTVMALIGPIAAETLVVTFDSPEDVLVTLVETDVELETELPLDDCDDCVVETAGARRTIALSRPSRHVIFAWSPIAKTRIILESDALIRHERPRWPSTTIRFGASTEIVPTAPVRLGEPAEAVPARTATRTTAKSATRPTF